MKFIQWHKVIFQKTNEQHQEHSVSKLIVEIHDFQVDLVQVLVGKRDERFLHHLKLVRSMIEQSVKGIPFAFQTKVVIVAGQFFGNGPESNVRLEGRSKKSILFAIKYLSTCVASSHLSFEQ